MTARSDDGGKPGTGAPVSLWHTFGDQRVPVQDVLLFCRELVWVRVPLELHLYPRGLHGRNPANSLVSEPDRVITKVQSWCTLRSSGLREIEKLGKSMESPCFL